MTKRTLKILRRSHDYSQSFVADYLHVEQSTYSRIEADPSRATDDQRELLCKLFSITQEEWDSESGPTITFNDSIKNNVNGSNGYHENVVNNYNDSESLKEANANLLKQNRLLIQVLEKLGIKLDEQNS